jgi:hypothetical protein
MAKHRRMSRSSKKVAAIGAATVTATALTVGAAPPQKADDARMDAAAVNRDVALSAAIDYTQLITDSSNSLDNILIIFGNVGGGASGAWNPIASATGGLLPTFTAGTTTSNLFNVADLLGVLTNAPNVGLVPGITPEAAAIFLDALAAGLVPITGLPIPGLGSLGDLVTLSQLTDLLAALNALNVGLPVIDQITGIPDLEGLLEALGVTATSTAFQSTYSWPVLGLGGTTTIGNTFIQLDSLTVGDLTDVLLGPDGLGVGGLLDLGIVPLADVTGLLDDVVATPSITAWIPAASGNYTLPLGGSIGWLATMPTVAIGPVSVAGIPLSTTDTVIAIPIFAGGATLPLGLGAFSIVTTPGITFPTATGVSTIAGTTVMSFNILGFGFTNVNTLAATYAGTNGINHNSGQNVLTLTTPLGPIPIPIVFSLGAFNAGTTGFGFTGPSLFGVGLLPPFQVGTAPSQQSPDGLIPAALLNLFLAPPAGIAPTQLTDLGTLLGLPNPFGSVQSVLNPLFNTAVAPFGSQITDALNSNIGPLTNGFASGAASLTGLLAQLTGGIAPTSSTSSPTPGAAPNALAALLGLLGTGGSLPLGGSGGGVLGGGLGLDAIQDALDNVVGGLGGLGGGSSTLGITEVPGDNAERVSMSLARNNGAQDDGVQDNQTQTQTINGASQALDEDPAEETENPPAPRKRPLLNVLTGNGNSATSPNGASVGTAPGTNRPTPVKDAVSGLRDSVKNLSDGVRNALGGGNDDSADNANNDSGDNNDD